MSEQTATRAQRGRKVRQGLVVSDKMDKTVVVAVEDRVKHPLYGKVMRRTQQAQGARRGQRLRHRRPGPLMETRPLSATKRWRVVEILEKAK